MTGKDDRTKFRIGIAGYGIVGQRRRHFIDQHARLQTVAVCDRVFGGSGTLPDGVQCHATYDHLLNEPLDALFVCMPNYMAAEVTMAALEQGLHVFCEKPPSITVEQMEDVVRVERAHPNVLLKYGFNHRYHESVREAIRLVNSGEFGEIVNVRGVYGKSRVVPFSGGWRSDRATAGGGILLDQGVHMLDLMQLFCGDFVEVKSFVSNGFWKHDVEDNAYALMKDARGRIAMLHSTATQWQHRFVMEIALSEGYLELRGILSGTKSYGQERLVVGHRDVAETGSAAETIITYLDDHSWSDEIDEFVNAMSGRGSIIAGTSADALAMMKLVFRIYWEDSEWRTAYNIPMCK
jgi:predicted dehydrogenase